MRSEYRVSVSLPPSFFFLSPILVFLCTSRRGGTSSNTMEPRSEWVTDPRFAGELTSLPILYAMFLPECRSVCLVRGGVVMTMADTTEVTEAVERRLLLASRCASSAGQPMVCAKFSMDGVTGLLWLASTRSRRLEPRRAFVGVGDALSAAVTAGSGSCWRLRGEVESGRRFLRIVTFRIRDRKSVV